MSYPSHNLQPNFKPIDHIFEDRLRQFTDKGGQYPLLNLPHFYDKGRLDTNTENVNIKSYRVPDVDGKTQRPLFKDIDFDSVEWEDANKGNSYGPSWKTFWFKIEWQIPEDWLSAERLEFEWDSNSEGLLYSSDGLPLQAFTGGGERTIYRLPKEYFTLKKTLVYCEIACNGMFGNGDGGVPDPNRYFQLVRCELVYPDVDAHKLFYDFWIIGDAARELSGAWKYQASAVANKIMDVFNAEDRKSVLEGRKVATKLLGDVDSDDVYHKNPLDRIDVYGVGNCHIDTAWLWPFAETKRKIVRSWTTQLKLADEYPEYVFVALQMQQFKWLKMYHPEIYKKVHEKFTTNQFLPVGGSWVENDTNLPNGESLLRQFLLGQRFQLAEFGVAANVFWLPDTFGYSLQVPQICQHAGIERFLTQKLSWNNINEFPLSTFNWVGIDGSQVLVHMPPANTYTAGANFGDVIRLQKQHKNLRDVPTGLLLFGHGDGGGGPTEDMLEKLRRCRGLANKTASIPTVHLGSTVDDFYEDVLEKLDHGRDLPHWRGEIYLEFHRGTYTTQANIKKYMRLGEIRLHDLEKIATLLSLTNPDYAYPAKELQALWEDLCLCQFHDVLPGSCIGMVYYEEVYPMLGKLLKKAEKLTKEAIDFGKPAGAAKTAFFNPLPWKRDEVVSAPDAGKDTLSICSHSDSTKLFSGDDLAYPASVKKDGDGYALSNGLITAKVSSSGELTSLIDATGREVLDSTKTKESTGFGAQYVLFDDEPLTYPAWDTELYLLKKFRFLRGGKVSVLCESKVEASLLVKHRISDKSSIETVISVQGLVTRPTAAVPQNNYVKFKVHVDWHETYKFLKVQFPTTIYTASEASYETQFGVTKRPTHFNTLWDVAKFEVCHHKFLDLSEFNFGVSVVNNSKYGAAVHGNLIRLSLLRSAKAPDDKADMGQHDIEYAVFPHQGPLGPETVRLGYNFNYRLEHAAPPNVAELTDLVRLDGDISLVYSHLKRAEDDEDISQVALPVKNKGKKAFVLRVYESLGGFASGKFRIDPKLKIAKVYRVNGLEIEQEEVEHENGVFGLALKGFEIASFKVVLA